MAEKLLELKTTRWTWSTPRQIQTIQPIRGLSKITPTQSGQTIVGFNANPELSSPLVERLEENKSEENSNHDYSDHDVYSDHEMEESEQDEGEESEQEATSKYDDHPSNPEQLSDDYVTAKEASSDESANSS